MKPKFAGLQAVKNPLIRKISGLLKSATSHARHQQLVRVQRYETGAVPDPVDWKNSFDWAAGVNNVLLLEVRFTHGQPRNYHGELLFSNGANRLTLL